MALKWPHLVVAVRAAPCDVPFRYASVAVLLRLDLHPFERPGPGLAAIQHIPNREREERYSDQEASAGNAFFACCENALIGYERCVLSILRDVSQATRAISTARLHVSPRFHLPPINVLVLHGPSEARRPGSAHLEGGFPLRCFQRLSLPDVATRQCPWRDNRYTRGQSIPVLSY